MAASDELDAQDARLRIALGDVDDDYAFKLLASIARLIGVDGRAASLARELLIRLLDVRDRLSAANPLLDALLREVGLFAYIEEPMDLHVSDLLALEAHRPLDYPDERVIFHPVQARAYRELLAGRSVILSAPTSFGKSLILDAALRSNRFGNVAVVVPTLALIDETRRRLVALDSGHKVVTHPSQSLSQRNVLVMTQERLLEMESLPALDLFMIDEFYKLSLPGGQEDRAVLLNHALRRLLKTGAPFYFAGPNVQTLASGLPEQFEASFIATDYSTVAVDLTVLDQPPRAQRIGALMDLCGRLEGPTLIYCSRPESAREVVGAMLEAGFGRPSDLGSAADWIGREFHPQWLTGRAIRESIGLHHGKLPRALAQFQVDAFNDGRLDWLVCTSTLIEGVNTSAKNVVIYDHILNRRNLDYFTFANIRGRSGRMRRHHVGRVFVFKAPPAEDLPTVDIPLYSQGDSVPESLLVQLDEDELKEGSRARLRDVLTQDDVPLETIRGNVGIDPERQIELFRRVRGSADQLIDDLAWSGFPTYDQLKVACELMVEFLNPIAGKQHEVSSASQLAFRMNVARSVDGDIRELVNQELANPRSPYVDDPDGAVESVLDFMRHWPGFTFPRLLLAVEALVRPVLAANGRTCDYSAFAAQSLNLFLPDQITVLEEYGLPSQVAQRIVGDLQPFSDLDSLLTQLRRVSLNSVEDPFERELLSRAQDGLGEDLGSASA